MKRIIYLLSFIFLLTLSIRAQEEQSEGAREASPEQMFYVAHRLQHGVGVTRNVRLAIKIYQKAALLGNAQSWNALGVIYKDGVDSLIKRDLDKAVFCFKHSIQLGHLPAYANLGLVYSYSDDATQYYDRSFKYFKQGADLGDLSCTYYLGLFYLKGLGTEQSYDEAVKYFKIGAEAGRPSSMYVLGLCYKEGYGVPQDKEQYLYWIEKSALEGYDKAAEELLNPEPVTDIASLRSSGLQQDFPVHRNIAANKISALSSGLWSGEIVHYDWSGKRIEKTLPVSIYFRKTNGEITGTWMQGDSIRYEIRGEVTDSTLLFENAVYYEQISEMKTIEWSMNQLALEIQEKDGQMCLTGNIKKYSPTYLEPGKPASIYLVKVAGESNDLEAAAIEAVSVSPNPFKESLTVKLEVTGSKQLVSCKLYNTSGMKIKDISQTYEPGVHTLVINGLSLTPGTYILRIKIGEKQYSRIVMKK